MRVLGPETLMEKSAEAPFFFEKGHGDGNGALFKALVVDGVPMLAHKADVFVQLLFARNGICRFLFKNNGVGIFLNFFIRFGGKQGQACAG